MSCPRRTLVAEPFANQMETIDRALIEVQSQPMQYYGRRTNNNNNTNMAANNNNNNNINNRQAGAGVGPGSGLHASLGLASGAHHQMNQQVKKTGNYNGNFQGNVNGNISGNMPASAAGNGGNMGNAPYSKYGYYNQAPASTGMPDLYGNGYRTTPGTNAKPQSQQHFSSPALAPSSAEYGAGNGFLSNTGLQPSSSVQGSVSHIPQVFNDDTSFSPAPAAGLGGHSGDSPGQSEVRKVDAFATFDPFGSDFSGFNGQGSLFSPVFSSSSKILGSGYASPATASNIWGSSTKSMTGDAAVWG